MSFTDNQAKILAETGAKLPKGLKKKDVASTLNSDSPEPIPDDDQD